MICQQTKIIGKKWSMIYSEMGYILGPCTYPAKFIVIITRNQKSQSLRVCGIHKNSIINHSKKIGSKVEIQKVKND